MYFLYMHIRSTFKQDTSTFETDVLISIPKDFTVWDTKYPFLSQQLMFSCYFLMHKGKISRGT